MTTYHLSPIAQEQQFLANGAANIGGKIYTYLAGTSTPTDSYIDNAGTIQTNPIVLNSRGAPDFPIWLKDGVSYKFKFTDIDGNEIAPSIDNIEGVSQNTTGTSEWVTFGVAPTYVDSTQFTFLSADYTQTFPVGMRVRAAVTGGYVYGTVTYSNFAIHTLIKLSIDSSSLNSGLSSVAYGILSPVNSSIPKNYADGWCGTATGIADNITLTVVPGIGAYTAGQRFTFVPAYNNATTAPQVNINSLGWLTIKGRSATGPTALVANSIIAGQEISIIVGHDLTYALLDTPGTSGASQTFTANGTFTPPLANFFRVRCVGPGGGGASGRRGAAGTARSGGGGGGGGVVIEKVFTLAELGGNGATIVCTVPAGGAGGAVQTSNDTDGHAGTDGGTTTFGAFLTARGGKGGLAGSTVLATGGAGGNFFSAAITNNAYDGAAGGTAPSGAIYGGGGGSSGNLGTASYDAGGSFYSAPGGGGGGGITAADAYRAGGYGGQPNTISTGGGGTSGSINASGSDGTAVNGFLPGEGGGGGGSGATTPGSGGNGLYGGGGGGGGASVNGVNSGAGGNGGAGIIVIEWW